MLWATAHLCLPKRLSSASVLVSRPAVGPVGTTHSDLAQFLRVLPPSPQLPELDLFHLWEHSLSTPIFRRCRVYLADCGDLICSLYSWWKDFRSSSLVTPSLAFSFGFISTSACDPPTEAWSWGCLGGLGSLPWGPGAEVVWLLGSRESRWCQMQGSWWSWAQEVWP